MTTAIASPGAMPGPLKGGLLAAGVFAACWGGAIWYWRGATGTPGTAELALVLLALPLALVGLTWFGGKLLVKRAAAARAAAAPAATAPATAAAPAAALPALAIVSSALRSPYGASAEELAGAIAGNKVRPDLDAELVDDDGFPVAAARCEEAQDEALQEEVGAWLVQNGMPELRFGDPQWRALTLGSSVVAELASRAGDLLPAEGKPPLLRLLPLLPADWTLEQRRAAGMWFKHLAAGFGWPAAQVALAEPEGTAEGAIVPAPPAALCTQLAREAARETAPVVALLVACASNIGQDIVDEWASKGILFTSGRPQGLVPGEGAAGLLLTDLRLAQAIEGSLFVLLDPAEEARREASAPARQRAQPALLGELAERAGRHADAGLAEVAMVVADSGQRQTRTLELMGMVSHAMPGLDESEDVFCVGSASGACGDVPFVTALALAQHGALVRGAPVLCLGNEDALHCSAHLLRPPPPEVLAS